MYNSFINAIATDYYKSWHFDTDYDLLYRNETKPHTTGISSILHSTN